ncbi:hypothetical protein AVEN_175236-1 [Araneus ventricosus]|uniref:Uncharacterized protein n=1 Tax=Araneus ventricosus TaxID=182803 RepID=A0A4Y2U8M5_ARAVE|nr:hypothetical protein AVEN_175236-1 [Araneus ventricosus]
MWKSSRRPCHKTKHHSGTLNTSRFQEECFAAYINAGYPLSRFIRSVFLIPAAEADDDLETQKQLTPTNIKQFLHRDVSNHRSYKKS